MVEFQLNARRGVAILKYAALCPPCRLRKWSCGASLELFEAEREDPVKLIGKPGTAEKRLKRLIGPAQNYAYRKRTWLLTYKP
jgi:hypothetical protein